MAAAAATQSPSTSFIEQGDAADAISGTFASGVAATDMLSNSTCVIMYNRNSLSVSISTDEGMTFVENDNLRNLALSLGCARYSIWDPHWSPEKYPEPNQRFNILKIGETFEVFTPPLDNMPSYKFTSTDGVTWTATSINYEKKNYASRPTAEFQPYYDDDGENASYSVSWHIGYSTSKYIIFVYKRGVSTVTPYTMISTDGINFTVPPTSNFNISLFADNSNSGYFPSLRSTIVDHSSDVYSPTMSRLNARFIIFTDWVYSPTTILSDSGSTIVANAVAWYATSSDGITWTSGIYGYDAIDASRYAQVGVSIHKIFERIYAFNALTDEGTSSSGGSNRATAQITPDAYSASGVSCTRYEEKDITGTVNSRPYTREAIIAYDEDHNRFICFNNPGSNVTWWSDDFEISYSTRVSDNSLRWQSGGWYANSIIDGSSKINANEKVVMSEATNDSRTVAYTTNYIIVSFVSGEIFRIPRLAYTIGSRSIFYNNQYKKYSYAYHLGAADWNTEYICSNIYKHTDGKYYAIYTGGTIISSYDGVDWDKVSVTSISGYNYFNSQSSYGKDMNLYHNGDVWCVMFTSASQNYVSEIYVSTSADLRVWTSAVSISISGRYIADFIKIPGRNIWALIVSSGNLYYSYNGITFSLIGNILLNAAESETVGITCMTSDGNRIYCGQKSTTGANGDHELIVFNVDSDNGSRSFSRMTVSEIKIAIAQSPAAYANKTASSYSITRLKYIGNNKLIGTFSTVGGLSGIYVGVIKVDLKSNVVNISPSVYTLTGGTNLQICNSDWYNRGSFDIGYIRNDDMLEYDSSTNTAKMMYGFRGGSASRAKPKQNATPSILLLDFNNMRVGKWIDAPTNYLTGVVSGLVGLKKIKNKYLMLSKNRAFTTNEPNVYREIPESGGFYNQSVMRVSRVVNNNISGLVMAFDEFTLNVAVSSDGGATWTRTFNLRELVANSNAIKYDFFDKTSFKPLEIPNTTSSYSICCVGNTFEVNISPTHGFSNSFRFYSINGIDWYYENITYSNVYAISGTSNQFTETDYISDINTRFMWIGSEYNTDTTKAMICAPGSTSYIENSNLTSVLNQNKLPLPYDIQYSVFVNGSYNSSRCKIFKLDDRLVSFHLYTQQSTYNKILYVCQSFDFGATWSASAIPLAASDVSLTNIYYIDNSFVMYSNSAFAVITPCSLTVNPIGFTVTYDAAVSVLHGREKLIFNKNTNSFFTLSANSVNTLSEFNIKANVYNSVSPSTPALGSDKTLSSKIDPTTPISSNLRLSFSTDEYGKYGWETYTNKRCVISGDNIIMVSCSGDVFTLNKTSNFNSSSTYVKYNSSLKENRKSSFAHQIASNIYKHTDGKHYVFYVGSRKIISTDGKHSEVVFDEHLPEYVDSDYSINQPETNTQYHMSYNGSKWLFISMTYNGSAIYVIPSNSLSSADLTTCWSLSNYQKVQYNLQNCKTIISLEYDDVNKRYFVLWQDYGNNLRLAYSTNGLNWTQQLVSASYSGQFQYDTSKRRISMCTDGTYLYFGGNSSDLYRALINSDASVGELEKINFTYLNATYPGLTSAIKVGHLKIIDNKLFGIWFNYNTSGITTNWGYFTMSNRFGTAQEAADSCSFYKSNVAAYFGSDYNHWLIDSDRIDYDSINNIVRAYPTRAFANVGANSRITIDLSRNKFTVVDDAEGFTVRAIKRVDDRWLLANHSHLYTSKD